MATAQLTGSKRTAASSRQDRIWHAWKKQDRVWHASGKQDMICHACLALGAGVQTRLCQYAGRCDDSVCHACLASGAGVQTRLCQYAVDVMVMHMPELECRRTDMYAHQNIECNDVQLRACLLCVPGSWPSRAPRQRCDRRQRLGAGPLWISQPHWPSSPAGQWHFLAYFKHTHARTKLKTKDYQNQAQPIIHSLLHKRWHASAACLVVLQSGRTRVKIASGRARGGSSRLNASMTAFGVVRAYSLLRPFQPTDASALV
eukprot:1144640-Pelagomonas_calceolata.AAC.6